MNAMDIAVTAAVMPPCSKTRRWIAATRERTPGRRRSISFRVAGMGAQWDGEGEERGAHRRRVTRADIAAAALAAGRVGCGNARTGRTGCEGLDLAGGRAGGWVHRSAPR